MPLAAKALEFILPAGVDRYIGLLVEEPDIVAGTYSELADSEYARVAHSAWTNSDMGDGVAARANNGAVVFPGVVDQDTTVTHWAIFDAAVAGNLLAAGPLLNLAGDAEPQLIATNDVPRFTSGELKLLSEAV